MDRSLLQDRCQLSSIHIHGNTTGARDYGLATIGAGGGGSSRQYNLLHPDRGSITTVHQKKYITILASFIITIAKLTLPLSYHWGWYHITGLQQFDHFGNTTSLRINSVELR